METSGSGNTRPIPSPYWLFTWFDYPSLNEVQKELETLETKKWIFQEEICPTTKKSHLQGFIQFNTKCRPKEKFKDKTIHWEKKRGTIAQCVAYCSKEDTRKPNTSPLAKGFCIPRPIRVISELKPWQKEIWELLDSDPDDRTIHWFYEEKGNTGKTALCRKICYEKNALYVSGKANDMKYAIVEQKHKKGTTPDIVLLDIPRAKTGYISYSGIEEIKNGIFFSPKYESGMVIYPHPHVVVFSNEPPIEEMLSKDRWNIIKIEN